MPLAGILLKISPRSAGAFCRDFTEKKSPQCRAYTWALQMEKSISPLFPGPEGDVVANDWCIIFHVLLHGLVVVDLLTGLRSKSSNNNLIMTITSAYLNFFFFFFSKAGTCYQSN